MAKRKNEIDRKSIQFHPIVESLPEMDAEELKAIEADIKENGVRTPVLVWRGMVVDGRNRINLADKHGKKWDWEEFEGTESEMIEEVFARNFLRRHLTSSQRAATVVEFDRLRGEARGKGRPAKGDERASTAELAAQAGTNKQYVADARAIEKHDPDLLAKVSDGDLSIPQAKAIVDRAHAKDDDKPKKPKTGKAPPATKPAAEEPEEPAELKDALGHVIPENIRHHWDNADLFDQLIATTKTVVTLSNKIADDPCGVLFDKSIVSTEARNIRKEAEERRPYTVCPKCHGRGCGECRKLGFVNHQQFKLFPGPLRRGWGEKADK